MLDWYLPIAIVIIFALITAGHFIDKYLDKVEKNE